MDELDQQLIARLRANARTTVAALAKQLQVARGTIQNRIARLERDGTIAGYTIRLGSQHDAPGISALMTISVSGNRGEAENEELSSKHIWPIIREWPSLH